MSMESSPLSAFFSAVSFCTKNWRDSRWSFTFTYSFPQWINEFNTSEVVSQEYMDGFSIRNRVGSNHFILMRVWINGQGWVLFTDFNPSTSENSPPLKCEKLCFWWVRRTCCSPESIFLIFQWFLLEFRSLFGVVEVVHPYRLLYYCALRAFWGVKKQA